MKLFYKVFATWLISLVVGSLFYAVYSIYEDELDYYWLSIVSRWAALTFLSCLFSIFPMFIYIWIATKITYRQFPKWLKCFMLSIAAMGIIVGSTWLSMWFITHLYGQNLQLSDIALSWLGRTDMFYSLPFVGCIWLFEYNKNTERQANRHSST